MKTPEQIAAETVVSEWSIPGESDPLAVLGSVMDARDAQTPADILDTIRVAIEADRAQREKDTLIIHLDEEWDAISAMREVHAWLARGGYTRGYEPEWELHDSYDREGEGE